VQRDGAHHGHNVVNVRVAYQQLSGEISALLESSRERCDDNAQAARQASALKGDLDLIISRGKQSVQEAFEHLRTNLRDKEAELLADAEARARVADRRLMERAEEAERKAHDVRRAHAAVSGLDTRGDEVTALNSYSAVKASFGSFLQPQTNADGDLQRLLEDVKAQPLKAQATEVTTLSARVPSLRRSVQEVAPSLPELN